MTSSIFESIKHTNEHDQEYWSARELYKILEYTEYGKFIPTIEKAKIACKNSGQTIEDHFAEVSDMVSIGSDAKKKLKPSQKILDHMGAEELAANLFRATQTEAKIEREGIQGQTKANKAHFDVGKKIRSTIVEIGGTMPENLPSIESVTKVENRIKKEKLSNVDNPNIGSGKEKKKGEVEGEV